MSGVQGGPRGIPTTAEVITVNNETSTLPNSRQLTAGTNITFDTSTPGELAINASGGGDTDATYVTVADETGTLPNARQLVAGTNITFDTTTPGQLSISASGGGVTQTTGTFTVTYTAGFVTQPTQDFAYTKVGSIVVLTIKSMFAGTSNATTWSTGAGAVPAAIRPSTVLVIHGNLLALNNGANINAGLRVEPDGTLLWGTKNATGVLVINGWTNTGGKGFNTSTLSNNLTDCVYSIAN